MRAPPDITFSSDVLTISLVRFSFREYYRRQKEAKDSASASIVSLVQDGAAHMDVPNEPREFKDKSLNSPLKIGLYGVLCHNTGTTYYVLHNIGTFAPSFLHASPRGLCTSRWARSKTSLILKW